MQCERLQFGLMHRFGQLEYDKAQKGKAAKFLMEKQRKNNEQRYRKRYTIL